MRRNVVRLRWPEPISSVAQVSVSAAREHTVYAGWEIPAA